MYKGSDRTTLLITEADDEIGRHLQGRYIGPTEAFARIFEYKMHEEKPTVNALRLHLPDDQIVFYEEDATPEEIEEAMESSFTTLMGYFQYYATTAPQLDREGRLITHLYIDFPQHFVWKNKMWTPRKRGFAIGRIPYCSPVCGER